MRERLDWLDAARGLGIIFVVLGHCLIGLQTAGLLAGSAAAELAVRLIYAFHMPLFFLLSGLTFERIARRGTPAGFLRDRVLRLIWPLALWTWVFFAFRALSGGLSNAGTGWADFPLNPLPPREHLWFLWALFVITLTLFLALRLWHRLGGRRDGAFWLAVFAGSLGLALWMPVPEALGLWLVPSVLYAPCLIAGVLLARVQPGDGGPGRIPLALAVFAAMLALAVTQEGMAVRLLVAVVAPVALLLALRGLLAQGLPAGPLAWLGQGSMAIFVSHTIFSAGMRILLLRLGVADPAVHLMLGTGIGLLAPMGLLWAARRLGLLRLAGF